MYYQYVITRLGHCGDCLLTVILLFALTYALLGDNALAWDLDSHDMVKPDRVFGFNTIDREQFIAPAHTLELTAVLCKGGKNTNCECPAVIDSFSLEQGLPEDKREKINTMIRAYEATTMIHYISALCDSSVKPLSNNASEIHIEGHLAYYSPDFVSIAYNTSSPADLVKTLNIYIPTNKVLTLDDVVNADERNKITEYLLRRGCHIPLKRDQNFTLFGEFSGRQLTVYFDKKVFDKTSVELKSKSPNENSDNWNACTSGLAEEMDYMRHHVVDIGEDSLAVATEHITNPLIKSIYH